MTISVDAMALYVPVANAGVGAVVRFGIYSDNDGRIGTLIIDAGTASINTPAMKTIVFASPVVLTPGRYWAVAVMENLDTAGVNPTMATASVSTQMYGDVAPAGSNNMFTYIVGNHTAGGLASNPTVNIGRSISSGAPHLWLRRSA
mgnify:FL=1